MIRTSIEQSPTSVRRFVQLVCDGCAFSTPVVDIGAADTARAVGLVELRARTGFVEVGRKTWLSVAAPAGIGETEIQDLCARCAEKKGKVT